MTHADEIRAVKALGEQIGYGNIMHIASALWDREWQRRGVQGAYLYPVHLSCVRKRFRAFEMYKHQKEYNRVVNVLDL